MNKNIKKGFIDKIGDMGIDTNNILFESLNFAKRIGKNLAKAPIEQKMVEQFAENVGELIEYSIVRAFVEANKRKEFVIFNIFED